jgi:hypothetical protein
MPKKKPTTRDLCITSGGYRLGPDGRVWDGERYTDFRCVDCRIDTSTIGECYWLHGHVWAKVKADGCLCIGCVEKRLGRQLTRQDFDLTDIRNQPIVHQAKRLRDRFGGAVPLWEDLEERPTLLTRILGRE